MLTGWVGQLPWKDYQESSVSNKYSLSAFKRASMNWATWTEQVRTDMIQEFQKVQSEGPIIKSVAAAHTNLWELPSYAAAEDDNIDIRDLHYIKHVLANNKVYLAIHIIKCVITLFFPNAN